MKKVASLEDVNISGSDFEAAGFDVRSWTGPVYGRECCNYLSFGRAMRVGPPNSTTFGGILNTRDAVAIDQKVDDGKVSSGEVFVLNARNLGPGSPNRCVEGEEDDPSATANLDNEYLYCRLYFWID